MQHCAEVLARAARQEKEDASRFEVKVFLFSEDRILYIEDPKEPTEK